MVLKSYASLAYQYSMEDLLAGDVTADPAGAAAAAARVALTHCLRRRAAAFGYVYR